MRFILGYEEALDKSYDSTENLQEMRNNKW